ncbi:MAG: DUF350 domain-containing protein [Bacteroidetes bacterium]|nr:DUF350 domain-containing protein [Bacteroidota bacterium]
MIHWDYVLNALVFSGLGLLILVMAFLILELLTPEKLWHEVTEKQNVAVAVLIGMFLLSMAHIIASAIRG